MAGRNGKVTFRALLLAAILLLGGCSYQSLQDDFIDEDFVATRGVTYGELERQALDIYMPKAAKPRATVVFIYGGSWTSGDRALYKFLAQALTSRGYGVVIPDYRLSPSVQFPAFVDDAADALAWTHANIATYGGDPSRLVVMGHSAGAHSGALVTMDPRWLAARGLEPEIVRAYVGLAGPYTFNPVEWDSTKAIFAPAAANPDGVRPIKLIRSGLPPMLLIHGRDDTTVEPRNTEAFALALAGAGVPVESHIHRGLAHIGVVSTFAWALRWRAPVLDEVDAFIASHVPAPSS